MQKETITIEKTETYTHMSSNFVPAWAKKLEEYKSKIVEHIKTGSKLDGVKFYNPLDVSNNSK